MQASLKRPATAAQIPLEDAKGTDAAGSASSGLKRPATSGLKCHKYLYHKHGKYGIKVNGREQLTVGTQ